MQLETGTIDQEIPTDTDNSKSGSETTNDTNNSLYSSWSSTMTSDSSSAIFLKRVTRNTDPERTNFSLVEYDGDEYRYVGPLH